VAGTHAYKITAVMNANETDVRQGKFDVEATP
jgi:hypothetical protein